MHLLQLEWLKMKNFSTFKVLILFYVLLLPSLPMIGKKIEDLPPPVNSSEIIFIFPTVWQFLGYTGNWLVFFFLGFMAVLSVTTEYKNKTLRQNIITGMSRLDFLKGKLYFIVAIALFATLYYTICTLVIGFINTENIYMSRVWEHSDFIPRYFLMCLGYMSFGLMIGLLVKRTGISLFLYISYIMFLENVIRYVVHFKFFPNKSTLFYPINSIEDLAPLPFIKTIGSFTKKSGIPMVLEPTEAIISSVIYIILFVLISHFILKKANL